MAFYIQVYHTYALAALTVDIFQGIFRLTIFSYLKMQVRPRASPGVSNVAYHLSLAHISPFLHSDARQMTIPRLETIAVSYNDQISVSTHSASMGDNSVH